MYQRNFFPLKGVNNRGNPYFSKQEKQAINAVSLTMGLPAAFTINMATNRASTAINKAVEHDKETLAMTQSFLDLDNATFEKVFIPSTIHAMEGAAIDKQGLKFFGGESANIASLTASARDLKAKYDTEVRKQLVTWEKAGKKPSKAEVDEFKINTIKSLLKPPKTK